MKPARETASTDAPPPGDKPGGAHVVLGIVRSCWSGVPPAGGRLVRGGPFAAVLVEEAAMSTTAARIAALSDIAAAGPVIAARPGTLAEPAALEAWLVAQSDEMEADLDAVDDARLIVVTWISGAAEPVTPTPRAADDATAANPGRAYLRAAAEAGAARRLAEDLLRLEAEALAAELAPRVRRWRIVVRPERDGRPAAHLDLLLDRAVAAAEAERLAAVLAGRARVTGPLPAFDALADAVAGPRTHGRA